MLDSLCHVHEYKMQGQRNESKIDSAPQQVFFMFVILLIDQTVETLI